MDLKRKSEVLGAVLPFWHYLQPEASHADGELYQTSLMSALLDGVYEGVMTYGELCNHGDFGLGTFNNLDGEMVAVDGTFYQLRSDGSATQVTPDQKTPFAVVTFFQPEKEIHVTKSATKQELLSIIGEAADDNLFSAIRISGQFEQLKTRTVDRQTKPFPPLIAATDNEPLHTFSNINGDLAGFRTPSYAQGLGVAGFHLHFIDQARQTGGHALDYLTSDVIVQIATLGSLHIELPRTEAFRNASLSGALINQQILKSEG